MPVAQVKLGNGQCPLGNMAISHMFDSDLSSWLKSVFFSCCVGNWLCISIGNLKKMYLG